MTTKHELLSDPLKVVDALKRGVAQTEADLKILRLGNLAVEEAVRLKLVRFEHLLEPQGVRAFLKPTVKGLRALSVYSVATPAPRIRATEYAPYVPENSRPYRPGAEDALSIKSRGV